jgi:hypothetical protein
MANYSVNSGQNIFDVVINTIQDFNSVYSLLQNNNIPKLLSSINGLNINYVQPPVTPPIVKSQAYTPVNTISYFTSIPNQSVYDVCLQTYGDLNNTYKLIQDSGFKNISNYPLPNTSFTFDKSLQKDAIFASYLSKKGIIINTVQTQKTSSTNYLLQEDGFDFDLENGTGKIELEN